MKTCVLAARSFAVATWIATGARPRTGPPLTMATFDPHALDGASLVYVCAHGLSGQPYWYGDRMATMASAAQVREADIPGAICYLAGCFGIGPMSDALLAAGAACVVADTDSNWSGLFWPRGSNELGSAFITQLQQGKSAGDALEIAMREYARSHREPREVALLESMALVGDRAAELRW